MARRRRQKRNALHEGLMGAVLGGLQFQMAEHTRKQVEQAELQKEQRLAAIEAARAERDHQYQLTRDKTQSELLSAREEKAREFTASESAAQREFTASENAANRSVQREGHAVTRDSARLSAERSADYQTYVDESGKIHRLPLNAQGDAALQSLQEQGRKLQLMEGSRGGRFSALPATEEPEAAGIPAPAGAGSRNAQPAAQWQYVPGKGMVKL